MLGGVPKDGVSENSVVSTGTLKDCFDDPGKDINNLWVILYRERKDLLM